VFRALAARAAMRYDDYFRQGRACP
jgi:hypothetical protein